MPRLVARCRSLTTARRTKVTAVSGPVAPDLLFASDELSCLLEEPQRPAGHRVRDPVHLLRAAMNLAAGRAGSHHRMVVRSDHLAGDQRPW